MNQISKLGDVLRQIEPTSRRSFLKRAVVMSAALPVVGSVLSACGGNDDNDETPGASSGETGATATMPARTTIPTPKPAGGGAASPEATTAATAETEASPTAASGGAAGEPKQGGMLVVMGHEGVDGLSPDYTGPTVNWACITQIHNAMVEMDPWFEYQPTLADSYEISDDGMTYTFKLHEGVPFHDGEMFSSADVKYTMEYYANPDNAMTTGSDFVSIDTVDAPDDNTVVITLKSPNAAFLTQGASAFIVPKHIHEPMGDEEYSRQPIGTGPFKLSDYNPASHVEMEAFEDHFRGRPHLDAYRLNTVPEPSVRAIALETGEADSSVWSLSTDDNVRLRDSGDFWVSVTSSTAVNHMPMDFTSDQFKEKEVRQALMWAIDRDTIVNDIWRGLAVKATTNFSPALAYYHDDSGVAKYDYDPEKAKQILDDAGWTVGSDGIREKNGVKLEWTCAIIAGDQARRPIAEAVQQWVSEIGCKMEIVESTSNIQSMRDHVNQMSLYNWTYGGSGGDPDATSTLHSDWSGPTVGTY